jgi:hypothetical protein
MPKIIKDSKYWRNQRVLEYKSRLQRDNNGCPWTANIIAIVKAACSVSPKSNRIINEAKRLYGLSDDDIMLLIAAWDSAQWNDAQSVLNKIKLDR